jgi:hypothetical protein
MFRLDHARYVLGKDQLTRTNDAGTIVSRVAQQLTDEATAPILVINWGAGLQPDDTIAPLRACPGR